MKMFTKTTKRVFAAALAAAIIALSVPAYVISSLAQESGVLQIATVSDIHYYPNALSGNGCAAYLDFLQSNTRQYGAADELLDCALTAIKQHVSEGKAIKYLLLPGDLSKDSEYEGHVELAQLLLEFEQETGIQVIVTNGNHDINNPYSLSFEGGIRHSGRMTTQEQFKEIYAQLGWDLACDVYVPSDGKRAGALSYAVQLDGGYRLIVMDTCKYTSDVTGTTDYNLTDGQITDEQMQWIKQQCEQAQQCGETVIGMAHHSIVKHFDIHATIFKAFIVDEWEKRADELADAGMKYVFTGHMHENEMSKYVSDNGNVIYDIDTNSLTGYPNRFREVLLDSTGVCPAANVETFDVDCEKQVVVGGVAYEKPYSLTYSFGKTFGEDGLAQFAMDMLSGFVTDFVTRVNETGSIVAALKKYYSLDVEALLNGLINGGIGIGKIDLFTTTNLMSFVADLDRQLRELLLSDTDELLGLIKGIIQQLLSFKVSDLPCTKFIDTHGIGNASRAGTLEDAGLSAIAYLYGGDQDISDDPFMLDTIDFFRNGKGTNELFDLLYDIILNQLLQDELLSKISFNFNTLFPSGTIGHMPAAFLDFVLGLVLGGDKSYKNIIDSFLSLGFFEFTDINGIADHFIEEYLTQSQLDSIGYTVSYMIEDLVTEDDTPDLNAMLISHNDNEVVATSENYRLPTMVTVTVGENAATSRAVSWYTKYSVTGTDIEIVPYSNNPVFTGVPTVSANIQASEQGIEREFPAVDLGIIGFMPIKLTLVRHMIKLTGLRAGEKYSYRVGDASRNWWSEAGVISAADNSEKVTFLHVTDPQSQNALQYERFHTVLTSAFEQYPDTDLVVSTGDQVDAGSNVNQWRWLLDTSSDVLMDTVFMPATGNHEDSGFALDYNFLLPNKPEQDSDNGVYYDFDYNNVHFMVLNTNDVDDDNGLSDKQIEWLKNSAKNSNAKWKVVSMHKALYSNGSHYDDSDVEAMRKQLKRLMPELGIDVVLQGHDHVYLRTDAMYNNRVSTSKTRSMSYKGNEYSIKSNPKGTIYVISGCAGVKNYVTKDASDTDKLFPRAECIYETTLSMFSAFTVDGNMMYFDAYTVDDEGTTQRVDNFAIAKSNVQSDNLCTLYSSQEAEQQYSEQAVEFAQDSAQDVSEASSENAAQQTTAAVASSPAPDAQMGAVDVPPPAAQTDETTTAAVAESSTAGQIVSDSLLSLLPRNAADNTTKQSEEQTKSSPSAPETQQTAPQSEIAGATPKTRERIPSLGGDGSMLVCIMIFGTSAMLAAVAKHRKKQDK